MAILDGRELGEELLQLRRLLDLGQRAIQVGGVPFVAIMVIPALVGLRRALVVLGSGQRVHGPPSIAALLPAG